MNYRILGLILAAGKGSRVKPLLEEDELVKPMIKIGDARSIDFALQSLEGHGIEQAVLSYPSPQYDNLDRRVEQHGVKILKQKAKHIRLIKLPNFLELPYVLLTQYYFSNDSDYLQSFDSILTMPCDLVLKNVDLGEMIGFHTEHLANPEQRQVTILSKLGTGEGRTELFRMEGNRITKRKRYESVSVDDYEVSTQAGIFIFSKGILKRPWMLLLGFKHNTILKYVTNGDWIDYGNPENVKRLKSYKLELIVKGDDQDYLPFS